MQTSDKGTPPAVTNSSLYWPFYSNITKHNVVVIIILSSMIKSDKFHVSSYTFPVTWNVQCLSRSEIELKELFDNEAHKVSFEEPCWIMKTVKDIHIRLRGFTTWKSYERRF